MSISKSVDTVISIIAEQGFETAGEVIGYFKKRQGFMTSEQILGLYTAVSDGYVVGELFQMEV